MNRPAAPAATPRRWRRWTVGAASLGVVLVLWLAFTHYQCRQARAFLATFAQSAGAGPGSLPGDEVLRSRINAFDRQDWQHLIQEGARGESDLERWLGNLRPSLPTRVGRFLPPPGSHLNHRNALTKAWLLSSKDLDSRRLMLLRATPTAAAALQPSLAELCFSHPRSVSPVLTRQLLEEITHACTQAPGLKLFMIPPLSWSAKSGTEPQICALLSDWARDPDPAIAEAAARTLARRPRISASATR